MERSDKRLRLAEYYANRAVLALKEEAMLTPKPGLVDAKDSGSHDDMNISMLLKSANVLYKCFFDIAIASYLHPVNQELREKIAVIGRRGEQEMFTTTNGINTHKGAIWAIGLLVSGSVCSYGEKTPLKVLKTAGEIAQFEDRFVGSGITNGIRLKHKYNIITALDEAKLGFPKIREHSLPMITKLLMQGETRSFSALMTLMILIEKVDDTCVLHRGSWNDMVTLQSFAAKFINANGFKTIEGRKVYKEMDNFCTLKQLSPGGSADLLAATLFIYI